MHHDFDGMTDEEIALLAQQGDADASEYLLNKYKNFVRSKARSYFLVGRGSRGHRAGGHDWPVQGVSRFQAG